MTFRKSTVALVIASTLLSGAATTNILQPGATPSNEQSTDVRATFNTETMGVYSITLKSPGGIDTSYFKAGVDRKTAIANIEQEQQ